MENISLLEVVSAIGGKVVSGTIKDKIISRVVIDSRIEVKSGLFVAIKGENNDGHNFISGAVKSGAIATVISSDIKEYIDGVVYIKVEDTTCALKLLAAYYRTKFNIPIVAVTGSVGKTTTKDMIAAVLNTKYNVLKTEGNFNSEIGVPLTIFNLNHTHDIAVIEMGMDHLGQIENISSIIKPDTAVITNIGVAHIEYLKTRENILKAKCEVFEHLNKNGTAILNLDDDMLQTVDNNFKKIWYGTKNDDADVYADNINVDYTLGQVQAKVKIHGNEYDLRIPGLSKHLVYAALTAISVGMVYNIEIDKILYGVQNYTPTKMRMEIHRLNNNILVINDTYNANPDSMKSLIDTVALATNKENKILILGDMFELGDKSHTLHMEVLNYALNKKIGKVFVTGSNMKKAKDEINSDRVKYYETKEELVNDLDKVMAHNSIIACKASRGMKFENITDKIIEKDNTL